MATLTLQVRLGISRGWRVRTLNDVKFYNQAIAHCLFIFSTLRARGYKDRIWTMNYTVFMSGDRYSVYVEYFLLPDHSSWKRGIQHNFCSVFFAARPLLSGLNRPGLGYSFVFKGAPHVRRVANIRRASRRKSAKTVSGAIWAWAVKSRILEVMYRNYRVSSRQDSPFATMESFALGTATESTSIVAPAAPHYMAKHSAYDEKRIDKALRRVVGHSSARERLFIKARRKVVNKYFGLSSRTSWVVARFVRQYKGKVFRRRHDLGFKSAKRVVMSAVNRIQRFLTLCSMRRLLWANQPTALAKLQQTKRVRRYVRRHIVPVIGPIARQEKRTVSSRWVRSRKFRTVAQRYHFWYFKFYRPGMKLPPLKKGGVSKPSDRANSTKRTTTRRSFNDKRRK